MDAPEAGVLVLAGGCEEEVRRRRLKREGQRTDPVFVAFEGGGEGEVGGVVLAGLLDVDLDVVLRAGGCEDEGCRREVSEGDGEGEVGGFGILLEVDGLIGSCQFK